MSFQLFLFKEFAFYYHLELEFGCSPPFHPNFVSFQCYFVFLLRTLISLHQIDFKPMITLSQCRRVILFPFDIPYCVYSNLSLTCYFTITTIQSSFKDFQFLFHTTFSIYFIALKIIALRTGFLAL